jgi:hypothetical protein
LTGTEQRAACCAGVLKIPHGGNPGPPVWRLAGSGISNLS